MSDRPDRVTGDDGGLDPLLEVRGLVKRYGLFALGAVSLSLPRGYIMGLVGPNGAGKTTLIKLVLGLVRRDAGTIRIFGRENLEDAAAIRSRIGFVHEVPAFYNHLRLRTVASIVSAFYARWDQPLFLRLAADFELPLSKRVYALSRGTKTKFALVLAMAHHAELLLLDEPSTGLDPVFRRELLEQLSAYIGDGTASVLFSTHITADLERVADFITLLDDGKVVFSETRDAVLERWALVRGGVELLEGEAARLFTGVEASGVGFSALTDDVRAARRMCADGQLVIERPSLEDIMFHLTRHAADRQRSGGATSVADPQLMSGTREAP